MNTRKANAKVDKQGRLRRRGTKREEAAARAALPPPPSILAIQETPHPAQQHVPRPEQAAGPVAGPSQQPGPSRTARAGGSGGSGAEGTSADAAAPAGTFTPDLRNAEPMDYDYARDEPTRTVFYHDDERIEAPQAKKRGPVRLQGYIWKYN